MTIPPENQTPAQPDIAAKLGRLLHRAHVQLLTYLAGGAACRSLMSDHLNVAIKAGGGELLVHLQIDAVCRFEALIRSGVTFCDALDQMIDEDWLERLTTHRSMLYGA